MDVQDHGTVPGLAAPELAHYDHVDPAPLGTAAAHAVVTPTSGKAPDAAIVGGPVQTETQCLIFKQTTDDGKRFAMRRVHLVQKGYSLHRTVASDGPVCLFGTRWGLPRELRDLTAVARYLDQAGGAYA